MFKINEREIGRDSPPYIVAELSANHNGSIEVAKETILEAKKSGADAVKLQTYTASSMTIDSEKQDFIIKDGLWNGYKLFDLYKEASTPYEWHKELFQFARHNGITLFSTPFDENAIDLLDSLNTPAYKIASFELTDLELIRYAASKKKPLLISTGMGSEIEIHEAISAAKNGGCKDILLFHCISSYPAPTEESNLKMLKILRDKFNVEVGLSDHTIDNISSISAIPFGAVAIEKHFILDRDNKGPDSSFSIEPDELVTLVKDVRKSWLAQGTDKFSRSKVETKSMVFRRSLYFVNNLKSGQIISRKDIRKIRPGFGLPPKHFDEIIGKRVSKNVFRGDRVTWESLIN